MNDELSVQCVLIQLDIVEFYPSITEQILDDVTNFAKQYTNISDKNLRIIKHCRKSPLFNNNEPWKKKNTDNCFDVTMGSYDGAEVCELVGIYLLFLLAKYIDKNGSGLYHDDCLILLRNVDKQKIYRIRKNIIKIFKDVGFKIEIQTNIKIVDFLDLTFNLENGTYRPYNSSCKQVFEESKLEYESALKNCRYNHFKLTLNKEEHQPIKRTGHRNVIWFNPPFSRNVITNVAKKLLSLLDKLFPKYCCCTEILSPIIKSHNKKSNKWRNFNRSKM